MDDEQPGHIRIVAAVRDVDGLDSLLTRGLGIARVACLRQDGTQYASYGLRNGDLVVLTPNSGHSIVHDLLGGQPGRFLAVGVVPAAPSSVEMSAGYMLEAVEALTGSQLPVLVGSGGLPSALDPHATYAIDHVAAVVHDEQLAAQQFRQALGGEAWLQGWSFPDFDTVNACVRLPRDAYVEFNRPHTGKGLFGAHLSQFGAGYPFACLRRGPHAPELELVQSRGYPVVQAQTVRGRAPGSVDPQDIGTVHCFSRRSLCGLLLMIFEARGLWALGEVGVTSHS